MYAARQGRVRVVESLLAVTTDVNYQDSKGFTVCFLSYMLNLFNLGQKDGSVNMISVVKLFCEHKKWYLKLVANLDTTVFWLCYIQALMWACAGGHADVVKLLLDNGADASKQKHDGKSGVDIAVFKKHRQVTVNHNFADIFSLQFFLHWFDMTTLGCGVSENRK